MSKTPQEIAVGMLEEVRKKTDSPIEITRRFSEQHQKWMVSINAKVFSEEQGKHLKWSIFNNFDSREDAYECEIQLILLQENTMNAKLNREVLEQRLKELMDECKDIRDEINYHDHQEWIEKKQAAAIQRRKVLIKCLQLRAKGLTFEQIGEELKISATMARNRFILAERLKADFKL